MPFGLLTGLTAALFWGSLDVITALGSRVIGSLRVTAGMQAVTAVAFLAIFLVTGATLPTEPRELGLAALLGLVGAGAYLSYFTGLQFGPIAVVSGMVAAFGGLTVVLSVVLRGASLSLLQAAGATIATAGVLLTALAFVLSVAQAPAAAPATPASAPPAEYIDRGACPFLFHKQGRALCAIHHVALQTGRPVASVKPSACRHWPLVLEAHGRRLRISIHPDAEAIGCVAPRAQLPGQPSMRQAFAAEIEEIRRLARGRSGAGPVGT